MNHECQQTYLPEVYCQILNKGGAQDKILVTTPFIEFYEIILIHFLFLTIFVGDVGLTFFAYQNGGEG